MHTLDPGTDVAAFWSELAGAGERILMTDYDGVLAPFHPDPRRATPYAGIPALLDRINGRPGSRVVVVTGRDVMTAVGLLGMTSRPQVWGSHGHQHLSPSGTITSAEPEPVTRAALTEIAERARRTPGVGRVEAKPYGVALHWRGTPGGARSDVRARTDALVRSAQAELDGLFVRHDFDGGIELLVRGRDKGAALLDVMAAVPGSTAAYLGDDVTDEDAFRAAPPSVLTVLVRVELRETAARTWLAPPEELVAFLERWDAACAQRH